MFIAEMARVCMSKTMAMELDYIGVSEMRNRTRKGEFDRALVDQSSAHWVQSEINYNTTRVQCLLCILGAVKSLQPITERGRKRFD